MRELKVSIQIPAILYTEENRKILEKGYLFSKEEMEKREVQGESNENNKRVFLLIEIILGGTSWGTFGILIPIVVAVFEGSDPELMIISISACMAGAVCGDHCSPISDTTIMASAGAQCDHVNHVSTQLPYAMLAAAVSFVTYLVAGFVKTAWIALPVGIVLMVATLMVIRHMHPTLEEHLENETQK